LRNLNIKVLLSTDDVSGYEVLPIARIKRAGMKEAAPQLDEEYIPPSLAVEAWPILRRDYVRAIYDMIGARIEVLSQQVSHRGIGLHTQEPRQVERLLMLMILDQAYGALRILSFAGGVHPLWAYTELCRLVSALSFFDKNRRPGEIPVYDHDDLYTIFAWAKREIARLLDALGDLPYEQRYFLGTPNKGMQVSLDPKWLGAGWQWYVGVQRGTLSESECRDLVAALDWKFGSSRMVDVYFQTKVQGVTLDPLERVPQALPPQGWIYYVVSRENAAWKDVQASLTLAMRMQDKLIVNLNELPGQRDLVISARGRQATLQICLFAVHPQT
jgi:type VI secretion system protein ImpJ